MKLTAEQAERLCAHFASRTPDTEITIDLSEVTSQNEAAWTPAGVQQTIRDFVDHEDNVE